MPISRFTLTLLAVLAVLAVASSVLAANIDDRQIIVGGDHRYPPYEFLGETGQPPGFNV